MRAKAAQEKLIAQSTMPYSIVRATQFFEFVGSIAQTATDGDTVRLPGALVQPMAADDVAAAVARIAVGSPRNGIVEVAGPEEIPLDEFVRRGLTARHDPRRVQRDPQRDLLRRGAGRARAAARRRCSALPDPLRGLVGRPGLTLDDSPAWVRGLGGRCLPVATRVRRVSSNSPRMRVRRRRAGT